jgi:ubiquinone/menaquinone biosynthesis C-methylase UbiE
MKETKDFFDKHSKDYAAQDRYQHLFYKWVIDNVIKEISKDKSRIVDLGSGTGELSLRIASRFPQSQILGVDISEGMISQAKKKAKQTGAKNISFILSPLEKLSAGQFDFAVSSFSFHHIKNKEQLMTNIYKMLPWGGKLIVGDFFEPSKKYEKEIEKLRETYPQGAAEFDRSWEEALKSWGAEFSKNHPKEYLVCPLELKDLMKRAGFSKQKILKLQLAKFAVVVGEK